MRICTFLLEKKKSVFRKEAEKVKIKPMLYISIVLLWHVGYEPSISFLFIEKVAWETRAKRNSY